MFRKVAFVTTALVSVFSLGTVQAANYHGCESAVAQALPYCDSSLSFEARVSDLMTRLTLDEKISLLYPSTDYDTCPVHTVGVDRLGLPPYMWLVETNTAVASACYDDEHCATTFVSPAMLASSFNRTSWRMKGRVISTEMRAFNNLNWYRAIDSNHSQYGIGLTGYGPNMNLVRDPRFGRNQELPSEDPFHTGHYASEYLQGMQERDSNGFMRMLAYVKHFADYTVEHNREHNDANVALFDWFDSFLPQYEIAFKEGQASGAMCSYNAENGHPSCANGWILNDVVRKDWKRPDMVVTSDCGAVNNLKGAPAFAPSDAAAAAWALMNGTDVEAGSAVFASLHDAVKEGLATEEAIDAAVHRIMMQMMKVGRFDPADRVEWSSIGKEAINHPYHRQINYEAALQGLVMLKNEDKFLPLKVGQKIAVVGPHAISQYGLLEDYYGDNLCPGEDHNMSCVPTLGSGIKALNDAHGGTTIIEKGVDINSDDTSDMQKALDAAKSADIVVLAIGIDRTIEFEGGDRTEIGLPGLQKSFAQKVLALGVPTVIVVANGGAVALDELVTPAKALVETFYPSTVGSRALAQTLFGFENRFGKLPFTIYTSDIISQLDMDNMEMAKAPGRTYKYFTGKPMFHYGEGLSYTTFSTDCRLGTEGVTCAVTNTGDREGDEVVLVFHSVDDVVKANVGGKHPVPIKKLIGFERVSLEAGETKEVTIPLGPYSLALVNENGERTVYNGGHIISVSRDGKTVDFSERIQIGGDSEIKVIL